jgi:hypothetical protein
LATTALVWTVASLLAGVGRVGLARRVCSPWLQWPMTGDRCDARER